MLADANGLSGDDALVAGSTLTVPEVKTSLNDASTFKPYDPGEITGPTTPSLPYIPPPDKGCGEIGVLIMVAVTVITSVATYGASLKFGMTFLQAGALSGLAGSAIGQMAGGIMGVTEGIDFGDMALGALSGAIGAQVSSALTGGKEGLQASTKFAEVGISGTKLTALGRGVSGLASYAGNVAGNKLLGRSSGFSWAGVASTVVGASLSAEIGGRDLFTRGGGSTGDFWADVGGSLIDGITTSTVDRMFGLGRQSWASIVGTALGSALGNAAVGKLQNWQAERTAIGPVGPERVGTESLRPEVSDFAVENTKTSIASKGLSRLEASKGVIGGSREDSSSMSAGTVVSQEEKDAWINQVTNYARRMGLEPPANLDYDSVYRYYHNGYSNKDAQGVVLLETVRVDGGIEDRINEAARIASELEITRFPISYRRDDMRELGEIAKGAWVVLTDLPFLRPAQKYVAGKLDQFGAWAIETDRDYLVPVGGVASAASAIVLPTGVLDVIPGGGKAAGKLAGKFDDAVETVDELADAARRADDLAAATGKAELRIIEFNAGGRGNWNGDLNRALQPNARYLDKATGYSYLTDELGRVVEVNGSLILQRAERNKYQQTVAGGSSRLDTDQGGHLIASIFSGPGERLNLVPMDANLNNTAWKAMENAWAKALNEGQSVSVRIRPIYEGPSLRPESFVIQQVIGDTPAEYIRFHNRYGGQ